MLPTLLESVGRRFLVVLLCLAVSGPCLAAAESEWRLETGVFHFSWNLPAGGGHSSDCRTRACDDLDWNTSNLETSAGFRLGAQKSMWQQGRWQTDLGLELDLYFTEYNLSQHDLVVVDLAPTMTLRYRRGILRPLVRMAPGITVGDDHLRGMIALEGGFEIEASSGLAVRLLRRETFRNGPSHQELGVTFVTPVGASEAASTGNLSFVTSLGFSNPGLLVDSGRSLKSFPYQRFGLDMVLGKKQHLEFELDSRVLESKLRTVFDGVGANERSQQQLAANVVLTTSLWNCAETRWCVRPGGGVTVARWEDDGGGLLRFEDGKAEQNGTEIGYFGRIGIMTRPWHRYSLSLSLDVLQWPELDLGETRLTSGLRFGL